MTLFGAVIPGPFTCSALHCIALAKKFPFTLFSFSLDIPRRLGKVLLRHKKRDKSTRSDCPFLFPKLHTRSYLDDGDFDSLDWWFENCMLLGMALTIMNESGRVQATGGFAFAFGGSKRDV
jgi:hypothetical protein